MTDFDRARENGNLFSEVTRTMRSLYLLIRVNTIAVIFIYDFPFTPTTRKIALLTVRSVQYNEIS